MQFLALLSATGLNDTCNIEPVQTGKTYISLCICSLINLSFLDIQLLQLLGHINKLL